MKFFAPISLNFGACRCDKHCKKKIKTNPYDLNVKGYIHEAMATGNKFFAVRAATNSKQCLSSD